MTGQTVRVWAPRARQVVVDTTAGAFPARPTGAGWFECADVPAGAEYAFRLDDGPRRADPRSRWQPAGAAGRSRPLDPGDFVWTDADFRAPRLRDAVLYELHVGTFSAAGTFAGALGHLDHLVDLGVTHVELMPVHAWPGRWGWGYDGVHLFAPHTAYGSPFDLQRLVDACHARGLAVVLDVVYNHLGPSGNHLAEFGPYFSDTHHTPWGAGVNLDGPGSDEVRRFFLDNARLWLQDYHVDGLRLDAMHAVIDTSARHWLEELSEEVDELAAATGRRFVLIAEHDGNDPRLVRDRRAGGYGLHAAWNDDVHHALHTGLTGEQHAYYGDYAGLDDLVAALGHGYVYRGQHAPSRGRRHGRPFTGRDADALVACLQNHDQVGNRAAGERIAHLTSPARQRVGAALLLTGPFTPLLFQGEEWAASTPFPYFADHPDDELTDAVRRGRTAEFASSGWDPDVVADPGDPSTFHGARLDWDERARGEHAETLRWYRTLLDLRRTHPALRDPALPVPAARPTPSSISIERGPFTVVANLGSPAIAVPLEPTDEVVAATGPAHTTDDAITLAADAAAIVRRAAP